MRKLSVKRKNRLNGKGLWKKLSPHVKKVTRRQCVLNDYTHHRNVFLNACDLLPYSNIDRGMWEYVLTAAALHGVSERRRTRIIEKLHFSEFSDRMNLWISVIPVHVEMKGKYDAITNREDSEIIGVLRDSDRIESLGHNGVALFKSYMKSKYPLYSDEKIDRMKRKYVKDVLIKLFPEGYFSTQIGKLTAAKLSLELEVYLD